MTTMAAQVTSPRSIRPSASCKVLIVGRPSIFRNGIHSLAELESVVSECRAVQTCTEGVELAKRFQPHVLLVDVTSPCGSTVQIAQAFRECRPEMAIMLYSDGDHIPHVLSRDAQAYGAFTRTTSPTAIKRLVGGIVRDNVMADDHETVPEAGTPVRLSGRQMEVLREMSRGSSNPEIARTLLMSSHTVKQHTQAIYQRLGVRNRVEAVTFAQRLGMLPIGA